ncbi:MAG: MerR family transcriptional regulator [Bacteroidales bacterium]|nr:MerR family transcriptional regulator [Candidatus Cryptobacteroides equifaecalis]
MDKLYYTISDVAEILGENISLVRYWSDSFPKFIKPKRNGKGNRLFLEKDVEVFKQIHFLTKKRGLTLQGVEKALTEDRASVEKRVKALDSLRSIREQLVMVRKNF